jgi:predicted O-methyltransferase YrrM
MCFDLTLSLVPYDLPPYQDIADALHDFNAYVANDPRTSAVLVPLRDGLTVIRKL